MKLKDKTFQFRTSSYLLDLLEKLKPRFGVNSSAKVIEALVAKEMGSSEEHDELENKTIPLTKAQKFELLINKLGSGSDVTPEDLLLFLSELSKLWGRLSGKYFYNSTYFYILLGDYIKILQVHGITFDRFSAIYWGYGDLDEERVAEFYALSLKQDLNGSPLIDKYITAFIHYAEEYFNVIDFNKYLNKQNLLTLTQFIYFNEITSNNFYSDYYDKADATLRNLEGQLQNSRISKAIPGEAAEQVLYNCLILETPEFCLKYQLHSRSPSLFFKLYLKATGITFFYHVNMWNRFLDGLVIDGEDEGKELRSYYSKRQNGFFLICSETYVRIDSASIAINVDVIGLRKFIAEAQASETYLTLLNGFIAVAGDI